MHVLSTPPAFILSQDQTLMLNLVMYLPADALHAHIASHSELSCDVIQVCSGHSKAWLFYNRFLLCLKVFTITRKTIWFFIEFSNLSRLFHCSVIKVLCPCRFTRQLLYIIKAVDICQELFLFYCFRLFSNTQQFLYFIKSILGCQELF